jgi:drug/metabolite transporter superfamily protein YnfA
MTKLTAMEPTQGTQATVPVSPSTTSTGLLGTKIPSSIAFLLGILLFLLPFAEIRCNGAAVANNTGVGIATGTAWKEVVTKSIFGSGFQNNPSTNESKVQKQDPNVFAIAALALGVIGVLIAFLTPKGGGRFNLFVGALAAVSLIAMLIDLRSKLKSENSVKSSELDLNAGVIVTVDGTGWFYFTIILFILGGVFSYLQGKSKQPA